MFPNGLIFGGNSTSGGPTNNRTSHYTDNDWDDDIVYVDFDPDMLHYVLNIYEKKDTDNVLEQSAEDEDEEGAMVYGFQNPFPEKKAYIVLREELDYYAVPPKDLHAMYLSHVPSLRRAVTPPSNDVQSTHASLVHAVSELKKCCGEYLLHNSRVFDALRRSTSLEPLDKSEVSIGVRAGPGSGAEQQLVDMLCLAGFRLDSTWGYRAREPGRCAVTSISLVSLVTKGNTNQMAAAQKLLLFWRKPARKCWWDGVEVDMTLFTGMTEDDAGVNTRVRLWSRRTWTLELALI
jgi:hypothetical protein